MAPRSTPSLLWSLLLLSLPFCLLLPRLAFGDAGVPFADTVACDDNAGPTCALQAGVYRLSISADQQGGLTSDNYYYHGVFSLMARHQGGGSSTLFSLRDRVEDLGNKAYTRVELQLYADPASNLTRMLARVVAENHVSEAMFHMPFDGSASYHTYTIQWSKEALIWLVDGRPMRIMNKDLQNQWWPFHPLRPTVSMVLDPKVLTTDRLMNLNSMRPITKLLPKPRNLDGFPGNNNIADVNTANAEGATALAQEGVAEVAAAQTTTIATAAAAGAEAAAPLGPLQFLVVPGSATYIRGLTVAACKQDPDDGIVADPNGCADDDSELLPWNKPLDALQLQIYNMWHYKQLVADRGWVEIAN